MVDVSSKAVTSREATASGRITLSQAAFALVLEDEGKSFASGMPVGKNHTASSASREDSEALEVAQNKARSKGNVLQTARLAAIMASKQTSSLIPLCHPLPLTHVRVSFSLTPEDRSVLCTATARCDGKTGVEMEALTAVSVGLLTVWDMLKAVAGKEMTVSRVRRWLMEISLLTNFLR